MKSNVIKEAFFSTMKCSGFEKKGNCWYRRSNETILVVNLQKSNYGLQYYINLAVWLLVLGEVHFPKEYECHIQTRASVLNIAHQSYWEREIFDLDYKELSDEDRFEIIKSFLNTIAIPFLLSCDSLQNLKRLFQEGQLKYAAIMSQARDLII